MQPGEAEWMGSGYPCPVGSFGLEGSPLEGAPINPITGSSRKVYTAPMI